MAATETNNAMIENGMTAPRLISQRLLRLPWRNFLARIVSPLTLLLLWEVCARHGLLSPRVIAAPSTIGSTLWAMASSGELAEHLLTSLGRALAGLGIGIVLGVALALVSGLSRLGEIVIDSPMQMLRTLPSLAVVPLFILWFGIGETTKVALIAMGTLFPIYLALFSGIRGIDRKLIEAGAALRLNRFQLIRHVVLPAAIPSFFVGLRYAFGISWLALVVVEQINTSSGIGYLASEARDLMRTDVIVICLLIYSLLGLMIDAIVRLLEHYALSWRTSLVEKR